MYMLHRLAFDDSASIAAAAILGLGHSGMDHGERLEIFPERGRKAVVRLCQSVGHWMYCMRDSPDCET